MKNVSKAMIMSAGVGSRLDPLTKFVPKPLVPLANKPVMDILFEKLCSIGINDVICNTYYLADEIINRYSENKIGINFNYIKEESEEIRKWVLLSAKELHLMTFFWYLSILRLHQT